MSYDSVVCKFKARWLYYESKVTGRTTMNSHLLHPSSAHNGYDSPNSSVFDIPHPPPSLSTPSATMTPPTSLPMPVPTFNDDDNKNDAIGARGCRILVISGGSGGNAICSAFCPKHTCFLLPVSDDGGSSSEIIRVLGGPSIGDIRSRLVRLIPLGPAGSPREAVRVLLAHRLPALSLSQGGGEQVARAEWRDIVEGSSPLWANVPRDRKEVIRGFLVYFEGEVLKRAHKAFSFVNGSIGNFFLSGAQMFFRSLPSALFLFASITDSQAHILPAVITNHTVTIAAELANGASLVGQCEISHPVQSLSLSDQNDHEPSEDELDGMGTSIPRRLNVMYNQADKALDHKPLESRICRLHYINAYGHEVYPMPNPEYLENLFTSSALVYSCGSLWTSIVPCLALRGVGPAIARSACLRAKIFLLNCENDRETDGYTALDYVRTIASVANAQYQKSFYGLGNAQTIYPFSAFITHLVYLQNSRIDVDEKELARVGIKCVQVKGRIRHDGDGVKEAIAGILAE